LHSKHPTTLVLIHQVFLDGALRQSLLELSKAVRWDWCQENSVASERGNYNSPQPIDGFLSGMTPGTILLEYPIENSMFLIKIVDKAQSCQVLNISTRVNSSVNESKLTLVIYPDGRKYRQRERELLS
jgi:hypothetical protein